MYSKENKPLAWVLLISLSVIWGSSFILMHEGLKVFKPTQLAAFRLSIAGIVFLPLGIYYLSKVEKSDLKWFALAGLLGNFIPAFCFAEAQTYLQSSTAGALNALTPFFTLLSGVLIFSKQVSRNKTAGILLGLTGALLLVLNKPGGGIETHYEYGGLILLATFLYGVNVNVIESKLSKYNPLYIASLPLSMILLPSIAGLMAFDFPIANAFDGSYLKGTAAIALLGLAGTGLGLILFNRLIQISNGLFASTVTYLMPIVSTFWGIFNHETMGIIQLISLSLILLGIFIVRKGN